MAQSVTINDLSVTLEKMQTQLAALTARVAQLEAGAKTQAPATVPAAAAAVAAPAVTASAKQLVASTPITEEEILAISAALGAYLGVRVHIRQIRLLSSSAWAQQGRVSVHAHIPYTHN